MYTGVLLGEFDYTIFNSPKHTPLDAPYDFETLSESELPARTDALRFRWVPMRILIPSRPTGVCILRPMNIARLLIR